MKRAELQSRFAPPPCQAFEEVNGELVEANPWLRSMSGCRCQARGMGFFSEGWKNLPRASKVAEWIRATDHRVCWNRIRHAADDRVTRAKRTQRVVGLKRADCRRDAPLKRFLNAMSHRLPTWRLASSHVICRVL